ncbi:hypothetical protein J2755_000132 [Methanohalophilus levihalophilus]|uniref:hypothetical protein n=1 Tax=Methanohalophilus levihalophilus TaxID=1431282 RepID=UPI001AEA7DA1|nr:hypothetical protein [Methanohalophilus levihalophilus]MBP2029212.1 hypothetical protein [Methanohalophilus levihalophilus]
MVEKTKMLHDDLVKLSDKMDSMLNDMENRGPDTKSHGAPKGFVPLNKSETKGFVELGKSARGHLK